LASEGISTSWRGPTAVMILPWMMITPSSIGSAPVPSMIVPINAIGAFSAVGITVGVRVAACAVGAGVQVAVDVPGAMVVDVSVTAGSGSVGVIEMGVVATS